MNDSNAHSALETDSRSSALAKLPPDSRRLRHQADLLDLTQFAIPDDADLPAAAEY